MIISLFFPGGKVIFVSLDLDLDKFKHVINLIKLVALTLQFLFQVLNPLSDLLIEILKGVTRSTFWKAISDSWNTLKLSISICSIFILVIRLDSALSISMISMCSLMELSHSTSGR